MLSQEIRSILSKRLNSSDINMVEKLVEKVGRNLFDVLCGTYHKHFENWNKEFLFQLLDLGVEPDPYHKINHDSIKNFEQVLASYAEREIEKFLQSPSSYKLPESLHKNAIEALKFAQFSIVDGRCSVTASCKVLDGKKGEQTFCDTKYIAPDLIKNANKIGFPLENFTLEQMLEVSSKLQNQEEEIKELEHSDIEKAVSTDTEEVVKGKKGSKEEHVPIEGVKKEDQIQHQPPSDQYVSVDTAQSDVEAESQVLDDNIENPIHVQGIVADVGNQNPQNAEEVDIVGHAESSWSCEIL